jgi:hypothetical protein
MARRTLSLEDQLRGVTAALRSRRTPRQLREGLQKRKETLEKVLGKPSRRTQTKKTDHFLNQVLK